MSRSKLMAPRPPTRSADRDGTNVDVWRPGDYSHLDKR